MPDPVSNRVVIPADLGVTAAAEIHAELLAALEVGRAEDGIVAVEIADRAATPLALQLLVSATRSLPPDRLDLGRNAAAALTEIKTSKEA